MITLTIILIAVPIILIIALFTRKGITTEASININRPQKQIFDYLANLSNQKRDNAWLLRDAGMKITGSEVAMTWKSIIRKEGSGSQRIICLKAPENIEIELVFEKPVPSKARYWLELTPLDEISTRVTWKYEGNTTPYYLLRVTHLLLQLRNRVRKYMEASLVNLKNTLEDIKS